MGSSLHGTEGPPTSSKRVYWYTAFRSKIHTSNNPILVVSGRRAVPKRHCGQEKYFFCPHLRLQDTERELSLFEAYLVCSRFAKAELSAIRRWTYCKEMDNL